MTYCYGLEVRNYCGPPFFMCGLKMKVEDDVDHDNFTLTIIVGHNNGVKAYLGEGSLVPC